jgi:hypothetical protein
VAAVVVVVVEVVYRLVIAGLEQQRHSRSICCDFVTRAVAASAVIVDAATWLPVVASGAVAGALLQH